MISKRPFAIELRFTQGNGRRKPCNDKETVLNGKFLLKLGFACALTGCVCGDGSSMVMPSDIIRAVNELSEARSARTQEVASANLVRLTRGPFVRGKRYPELYILPLNEEGNIVNLGPLDSVHAVQRIYLGDKWGFAGQSHFDLVELRVLTNTVVDNLRLLGRHNY